MRQTHYLKCWPEYFKEVCNGNKKFELRKDDRPWKVGDLLILQEFDPFEDKYTGMQIKFTITYILRDVPYLGLMEGACILSLGISDNND